MTDNIKVLAIRAGMSASPGRDAMQALIFPLLAQATPPGFDLSFSDDRTEKVPDNPEAALIAISVETFAARRAYQLADQYRAQGKTVCLGGFHPSACPDEASAHADTVIVGDAEDTWPQLLRDFAAGSLKPRYVSSMSAPLAALEGRREILKGRRYLPLGMLETSRGCRWNCDFCSIQAMYKGCLRAKPIADIAAELREIPQRILFLSDDNIFRQDGSFEPLLAALKASGKRWACQISMEALRSDENLRRLQDSGCILVLVGFESLNEGNLADMGKVQNRSPGKIRAESPAGSAQVLGYEDLVRRVYAHGLMIYATFVVGYDHDGPDTFDKMLDFALRMNFTVANFNPLIPMPGTALYERLEQEGRLLKPEWWIDPGYRYGETTFAPRGMTPKELEDGCFRIRSAFYSKEAIRRRFRGNPLHRKPLGAFVYQTANQISRLEIKRKQGQALSVGSDRRR